MSKVVPLPVCVTQVTPNGYRWFCWRCGTAAPKPVARERVDRDGGVPGGEVRHLRGVQRVVGQEAGHQENRIAGAADVDLQGAEAGRDVVRRHAPHSFIK